MKTDELFLLKANKKQKAYTNLRELLAKRKRIDILEEEANEIAAEAVGWTRSQSRKKSKDR